MEIKNVLNSIGKEFIYGTHFTSLCISAIVATIIILLNQSVSLTLLIIAYLLAFISYRYNYHKGLREDFLTNQGRVNYFKKYLKFSQILIITCVFLLALILIFYTNMKIIIFSIIFLVIGLFYTQRFKNLTKNVLGFKNLYISASFGLLTILVGLYYSIFSWSIFFIFLFIFLRIFINTVFCDIKDIESDKKEGLKTFPVVFEKAKTLHFLHILNLLSFLPIVIGVYLNFLPSIALILLSFYFYDFYYLKKSEHKNRKADNFLYIIPDIEVLLWPIILFSTKQILLII